METIRVLIADDHPLVRCGIRETLRAADDITIAGEASRGDEAQRLCRELQPDVLLLDLQMPGATAVETVTDVRAHCPQTRVIILTAYDDEVYVRRMLAEGAVGYVLKDEVTEVVLTAIRTAMQGGIWLSRAVSVKLATGKPRVQMRAEDPDLTERERQLLDGIAHGWRNGRIADELSLTEKTVRHYVSDLYAKLDVSSRGEAIIWAKERGFGMT